MKDKIAEIINEHCTEYQLCGDRQCICSDSDYPEDGIADEILTLVAENIQVQVECPECHGSDANLCDKDKCDNYEYHNGWGCQSETGSDCPVESGCYVCKRKGKILRPATSEDMEIGGVLSVK